MKTKRIISIVTVTTMLLVTSPLNDNSLLSQEPSVYPEYDWSLLYPDGFDELDIIDGGDLGEASITCSGNPWGRCLIFVETYERNYGNFNEYRVKYHCIATGDVNNYCPYLAWFIGRLIDYWMPSYEE